MPGQRLYEHGCCHGTGGLHTVMQNLKDLEITKEQLEGGWYDKIITGDLGKIGNKHWQIFYGMRVWKRKDF